MAYWSVFLWLLALAAGVTVVVLLSGAIARYRERNRPVLSPRQLLQQRLDRGEIDAGEFVRGLDALARRRAERRLGGRTEQVDDTV